MRKMRKGSVTSAVPRIADLVAITNQGAIERTHTTHTRKNNNNSKIMSTENERRTKETS